MSATRVLLSVQAGIIPGEPDPDLSRQWSISSDEWEAATDTLALLAERVGQMQGYAALLMLQPNRLNWVHVEWTWL